MGIEELKLKAIYYLIQLKTENSVKEIVEQLEKLSVRENKTLNLSQHYPTIKKQYGTVFEKLASS